MEFPFIKKNRRTLAVIGVLLTLGFPALPVSEWENEFANVGHLVGYEIIWWAVVAFVLLYVLLAEGRPLRSIGIRAPGVRDILLGISAGVVILAGLAAIYYVLFPLLHVSESREHQQMNQLITTPLWWRFISVVRAAVAEEVLFRGYALERLEELTGSVKIAATVSCAIFALEHVGQYGWTHLLLAGFAGAVLTGLYVWRRNLSGTMIAHFIVDGVALLS